MIVEIIRYNGQLMYRHPLLEQLVLAPKGAKLGDRMEFDTTPSFPKELEMQMELPINWEDRPKL